MRLDNMAVSGSKAKWSLLLGITLSLTACQNMQQVMEARESVDAIKQQIEDVKTEAPRARNHPLDMIDEQSGAWLAKRSVAIEETDVIPARFYQPASFTSGRRLPLSLIIEQIATKQGIVIRMSGDTLVDANQAATQRDASRQHESYSRATHGIRGEPLVQLNYSGTLRGLLDALASRSGTYWTFREGGVVFARYMTRTFQIASMPGTSKYSAQVGSQADAGGQSGSSGGSDSTTDTMKMNFGGGAKVDMQSDLSFWTEANATIQTMLSPAGKATSSTVTNSVTVTDTAEVIDRVRRFVDRENAVLGRQVSLQVKVYSVRLRDEASSGIDWNLAFQAGGVSAQMGLTSPGTTTGPSITQLEGPWKNSKLIVAALQEQGDVTTVIDTSVVTLNNQPAPLAVTNNRVYLSKISISRSTVGTGVDDLYSADPANLTTGFVMNLMPTLLDNRSVMLQVQLSLSSLTSMTEAEVGAKGKGGKIATPETSAIQTLQRASLKSGDTLLMTGFRRELNDNQRRGLFSLITGYANTKRTMEEFVVVITPQLIEGV